jgi:hypothetical protein
MDTLRTHSVLAPDVQQPHLRQPLPVPACLSKHHLKTIADAPSQAQSPTVGKLQIAYHQSLPQHPCRHRLTLCGLPLHHSFTRTEPARSLPRAPTYRHSQCATLWRHSTTAVTCMNPSHDASSPSVTVAMHATSNRFRSGSIQTHSHVQTVERTERPRHRSWCPIRAAK